MVTITTKPATTERWADVQHALTGGGDGASCQCAWLTLRAKDWNNTTKDERTALLHNEIAAGPPPGLIAYVDGEAAGWVRVGPRTSQARLAHTRAIATATAEPLDDDAVWAITCFVVRREHRGQGITAKLMHDAVAFARDAGARLIEGYPVDTTTGTHASNNLFHGTLSTFRAAGFEQRAALKPGRPLVALELTPTAANVAV